VPSDIITDIYGLTAAQDEAGAWTRGGITVGPCDAARALATFNGMAPEGWQPPLVTAVPESVTPFQFKAMLYAMPATSGTGTLYDQVSAAVAAQGGTALLAWEYATEITRGGTMVNQIAAALGVSSAQLDDIFIHAASISA
jgi:hypothetical protein